MLVDMLRTMGKQENFKKLAVEIDKTGEFPTHLVKKYADLGLLGMTLSPEYGGGGQPATNAILAVEELAKFSPIIATPVFESNIGPVRAIDTLGTQEQKKAIIPGVCKGELSVSVCMTEPEAGSDLTSLSTKAGGRRGRIPAQRAQDVHLGGRRGEPLLCLLPIRRPPGIQGGRRCA